MTYNTGNPIGSTDPRDLYDNAKNFDAAVNSDGEMFTDRLGNSRRTLAGMQAQIELIDSQASVYRDQALNYAEATGVSKFADTYAAMAAAVSSYADGTVIEVFTDETQGGIRTRYIKQGGVMVGPKLLMDYLREAYDGGKVQNVLDGAKTLADYAALRAYAGSATGVRLTNSGIGGIFQRDDSDTSTADNGIDVIVASNGKRWKRRYTGVATLSMAGAKLDGTTDDTAAVVRALARGKSLIVDGPCRVVGSTLLSLTGLNYFNIKSNTDLVFLPSGKFLIMSNQQSDGTRFEMTGANIRITNGRFSEVNTTLGRYNVYGTLAGAGCSDVVLDNCEVNGSNGAGFHFRENCTRVTAIKPKAVNTKADGFHVQRGCSKFKIVVPHFEANEDDCLGLVSHGRNEGFAQVRDIEVVGGYYGQQANNAVGSGIAIIGARDVRIMQPHCYRNGLSGIRISDWNSVGEGSYAPANITIEKPVCINSGQVTGVPGALRDGISIYNARNIVIDTPQVDSPVGSGITISDAGIDINIKSPRIRRAGERGIWVAAAFRNDAHIRELATQYNDHRYSSPAQLGCEYLNIEYTDVDGSNIDGIYIDGGASAIRYPVFTKLRAARSNRGNSGSIYGVRIINTVDMYLDGLDGGASASATALAASFDFSNAGYKRITGLPKAYDSLIYPTRIFGDKREFWYGSTPTNPLPAAFPPYSTGDIIRNWNPAGGTVYWVCSDGSQNGGAGFWIAK